MSPDPRPIWVVSLLDDMRSLGNQLIHNNRIAANDHGEVVCSVPLGGLLKYYRRDAA